MRDVERPKWIGQPTFPVFLKRAFYKFYLVSTCTTISHVTTHIAKNILPLEEWQQKHSGLAEAIRRQSVVTPTQLCDWEAEYYEAFRSLLDYTWAGNKLVSTKTQKKSVVPVAAAAPSPAGQSGKRTTVNSPKQDEKRGHQPFKRKEKMATATSTVVSGTCKNCEKPGHHFKQCTEPRVCFGCRKAGHTSQECTATKQTAVKSAKNDSKSEPKKKPNAVVNVALVEQPWVKPITEKLKASPGSIISRIILHVNNLEFETVLDSGAQTCIMPHHLLGGLVGQHGPPRFESISGINGGKTKSLGSFTPSNVVLGTTILDITFEIVHAPALKTLILSCSNLFALGTKFATSGLTPTLEIAGELLYDDGSGIFRPQFLSLRALEHNHGENPDIVDRWEDSTSTFDADTNEAGELTEVKHLEVTTEAKPPVDKGVGEAVIAKEAKVLAVATEAKTAVDYNRTVDIEVELVGAPDKELIAQLEPALRQRLLIIQQALVNLSNLPLKECKAPEQCQMKIVLTADAPERIIEPQHRHGPRNLKVFESWIAESLLSGLIEECPQGVSLVALTNHCFPSDGIKIRVAITALELNKFTVKDPTFPQSTQDIRESLNPVLCRIKSVIDIRWAFNMVEIAEESRYLTSFYGLNGKIYRYCRMPFGLTNAPAEFNKFIRSIIPDNEFLKLFVDDILIHTATLGDHVSALEWLVRIMVANNIPVRWQKVQLFRRMINYVGIRINEDGSTQPNAESIDNIKNCSTPRSLKELQQFIGVVRWVAPYVANLSKPLSVLGSLIRKNVPFAWKDIHEEAFNEAKEMCGNYFATSLMDWSSKDALSVRSTWTDASQWGGGAGLFQGSKLVALYSFAFTEAQMKWAVIKKEAYAIVQVLGAWRHLLLGAPFVLYMDHRPLLWLIQSLNKPKQETMLARWFVTLQSYNMVVLHCKGVDNVVADAMSRPPFVDVPDEARPKYSHDIVLGEAEGEATVLFLTVEDAEPSDKFFRAAMRVASGEDFTLWQAEDVDFESITALRKMLGDDGVLRVGPDGRLRLFSGQDSKIVPPDSTWKKLFEAYHTPTVVGHRAHQRSLDTLAERFVWPFMPTTIKNWAQACEQCQKAKGGTRADTLMVPSRSSHRGEE